MEAVSWECCQHGMGCWWHCQPQPCQLPAPGGTGLTGRALQHPVFLEDGMGLGSGSLARGSWWGTEWDGKGRTNSSVEKSISTI